MAYTQENRLIGVDTPLGKDALLLQGFSGQEGISQLFRFQLDLLAEKEVDAKRLVGQPLAVTLHLSDGGARYFNGYVSRFSQGQQDGRFFHYQAEMVPWLWFLTRTADCRIFQNLSIPDIVTKVFKDYGFNDFKNLVRGVSDPLDYCVQYRETAFNFVSRLMEQYGIFYFFEHTKEKHTLVLANGAAAHEACPTQASARFEYVANTAEPEDVITNWTCEQEYRPGKYTLRDFSFETPNTTLEGTVDGSLGLKDAGKFELYDYPGEFDKKPAGETLVKVRIEEEEAAYTIVEGASTCRAFVAGFRFDLEAYADQNGPYVLTEVRHVASVGDTYNTDAEAADVAEYTNHFRCIPHGLPYRPARTTPRPTIMGTQTAIVVGKQGEEIWSDKYGRVKVQFHWDREGKHDENSSCWIRVAQAWSGKRWGTSFLPRVGQEVVVDFLEGDPDRPVIVGSVYNAEQMPPYPLPEEQTKSTIKSYSSKGGGGFNELRFEDKKGEEQIFIHAERNQDNRVKLDSLEWVGNDRHLIVVGDQLEQVKTDKHLHVIGDQNEKVDGILSLETKMDRQEKVKLKTALDAGLDLHMKAKTDFVVESTVSLTLQVGGNFININPAGIFVQASMLALNAGGVAGSGAGASLTPPKDPLEADKAKPGEGAAPPAPVVATPGKVSPQALALRQAARTGAPFCQKCADAAYAAAIAAGATPEEAAAAAREAGLAGAEPSEAQLLEQATGPVEPGAGPPPGLQPEDELTWIEIVLLDEDDKPVPNEPCRIAYPDGTTRDETLDAEGKFLLRGIRRGIYKVSFPNRDEGSWQEIETAEGPEPGQPETAAASEAAVAPAPAPSAAAPGQATTDASTDWVEFELVDDEGHPIAGEKYVVTLPDGTKKEGVTDASGRVRLDGIPGGDCMVTFPNMGDDFSS